MKNFMRLGNKKVGPKATHLPAKIAEQSSIGADRKGQKKASQNRTATTTYPCYLPVLGEFSGSWSF
jgi:hypothetical protein